MAETNTLPFELTAKSLGDWLITIDQLPHAEKANQLYKVITELSNRPADASLLFPILNRLTETVLVLSGILEHRVTSEVQPSAKTRKLASFSMQLPKKLGVAYGNLSNDRSAANALRALCLYRAMQMLCLLIKRNALFYEAPDLTLWKKLGELYLKAETSHLLTVAIEDRVPGLYSHLTIEAVLKHALLFYVCDPYRNSPSGIADLFAAVANLVHLLKFGREPSGTTLCYWRPCSRFPPRSVNPEPQEEPGLYLDTSGFIDYFETRGDTPDVVQTLLPSCRGLTAYADIRRSVDPSSQTDCKLIVGISQSLKFLNVLTSRYRILQLSGAFEQQSQSPLLELVPMDDGKDALAFLSTKILKDDVSLSVARIKTFRTNDRAFCTAKIGNLPCSMDEPLILVYENQRPFFAVIRHMQTEAGARLTNILVEIMDGAVYPVELEGSQGFILVESASKAELFLPPGDELADYSELFTVKMMPNQSFRVAEFIESTAHFVRYRATVC